MQKRYEQGATGICLNPLCENPVVTHPKAVRPRRFCSDRCRLNRLMLSRVAKMLLPLGMVNGWKILERVENRGSEDKAGVEIVNPRAI